MDRDSQRPKAQRQTAGGRSTYPRGGRSTFPDVGAEPQPSARPGASPPRPSQRTVPLVDTEESPHSVSPATNAQSQPTPRAGRGSAVGMFRAKMAPFILEPGSRYRRPDLVAQLPRAIAILGWGAAGVALMFIDNARPRRHGLDRFFNIYRAADGQDSEQTAAYLLVLSLALAVGGLIVNARRMRRRDDRYDRGLIALAISSSAALLYYVLR